MDGASELKETARATAPVASSSLSVNVFAAPGKAMVGERPKPFFSPQVERLARRLFPGQVATKLVAPEPYEHDTFTLEGHELRIIEQGRTDSPDSTSLYVPSIGLIVAGDVVYNQCRMYVGDTTPESRKNWIADLDRLAALNPTIVVADHKKSGAPDSPSAIQETKRYLEDFDRVQKTATSEQELFNQMTALYPDWVANQSWLMFGFPG
jgi:glyoxylase-like metal-dependent hydrolase (beta-lactamase superfamily II)